MFDFPKVSPVNHSHLFFPQEILDEQIGVPAEMGMDGAILWGASKFNHKKNPCSYVRDYINTVLGPYVKNLTRVFTQCSESLCGGRGRCVRNDLIRNFAHSTNNTAHSCVPQDVYVEAQSFDTQGSWEGIDLHAFRDYSCQCYPGWSGSNCQSRSPGSGL